MSNMKQPGGLTSREGFTQYNWEVRMKTRNGQLYFTLLKIKPAYVRQPNSFLQNHCRLSDPT